MTFGKHIRQWREERGVGLRQFAKALGVSPTFVSKMERGTGPLPGKETIRKMAAFFSKNPDELFSNSNFGNQLVSHCDSSSRPRIMKSIKCSQLSKTI